MSESGNAPPMRGAAPACVFDWCTTRHGDTAHPDDEDHRSRGRAITLRLRTGSADAPTRAVDVEVGLLHRREDDRTRLVAEDGASVYVEIDVADVRSLVEALGADAAVRRELALGSAESEGSRASRSVRS